MRFCGGPDPSAIRPQPHARTTEETEAYRSNKEETTWCPTAGQYRGTATGADSDPLNVPLQDT
jgi:hypothetical protein